MGAETVSAALIVKNEEQTLARCLESIRDAVDEIVVVDTGSTDDTVAVARQYAATIRHFPWIDDFAAARQVAFDHAGCDWIFWLDADDVVQHAENITPMIRQAGAAVDGFAWPYVVARDAYGHVTCQFWRERCVRNRGAFRWAGRVHETLVADHPATIVRNDSVIVEHHKRAERGGDARRNLRILEQEYAESQGAPAPRLLFYLGREYADVGDYAQAIDRLQEYLTIATWDDEAYLAQTQIAHLYRLLGEYEQALSADLRALKLHPDWPQAYFGLAQSHYYRQEWNRAVHWCDVGRGLPPPQTEHIVNPMEYRFHWIIYYTVSLYHLGQRKEALRWTRHALHLRPDDPWHCRNLNFFLNEV